MEPFHQLQVEGLRIRRNGAHLLGPVDLQLTSRGITVVLGHNGAGKSLFIEACHGVISPNSGRILWNGIAARDTRRNRGFMSQTTPVLRRSVAANIAFPLVACGAARTQRKPRVQAMLDMANLPAKAPAALLSGGERKRLALARAAVTAPPVLILDEPCAGLDPSATRTMETMIRQLSAAGTKILMVTQDIAQARRLGDDVLMFQAGKLATQETAAEFFAAHQPAEISDFLAGNL